MCIHNSYLSLSLLPCLPSAIPASLFSFSHLSLLYFSHTPSLLPSESISLKASLLLWLIFGVCCLALLYLKPYFKQAVVVVGFIAIIRAIITLGIQPTFSVLGFLQVTTYSPLYFVMVYTCTCTCPVGDRKSVV